MEIILKENVEHLGDKNDLVTVRPGYGRNYLIPKGIGILATDSAKKVHAENMKQRAHKEAKLKDAASKTAAALKEMIVKVGAKVGEKGKIFGSVNSLQVADAINALGYTVERKNVTIKNEPIKNIGKYEADVKLHKEVTITVMFEVVGE